MGFDHGASRVFASTAATRDRQMRLHFIERRRPAVHDFADLAVADGMAEADVHCEKAHGKPVVRLSEYK